MVKKVLFSTRTNVVKSVNIDHDQKDHHRLNKSLKCLGLRNVFVSFIAMFIANTLSTNMFVFLTPLLFPCSALSGAC